MLEREPLRLAVTASGIDKGTLLPADVVLIDGRGAAVDAAEMRRPSAEGALHARIAALTGAGAVVHVHPLAARNWRPTRTPQGWCWKAWRC